MVRNNKRSSDEDDRPSKKFDTVAKRSEALQACGLAAATWYAKFSGLGMQNAFTDYIKSEECAEELCMIAGMAYTPKTFFKALRNPSSAVGMVQHLDAEHFSKWALYACEEDPEILYQDPSIPPGFHIRVCTQVKITGRLSFLEHFRNDSVTSLALSNIYGYGKKYAARLVSADMYLSKIEDQTKRSLTKLCNNAGVKQIGRKYLKGCFALVIMNELSSMREIAMKYEKLKGAYEKYQSEIRGAMDKKAREKFALLDDGPAKNFIKNYLSACLQTEKKKKEEPLDLGLDFES